jgi:hypothetical protein
VIAGIVLFIVRLTPSPEGVRGASRFRRELILTAMIVAALLAYGLEGFTKDLSNEPPAAATGASPGTMDVAACKQSKEWQDLRVFWSLITGNPAVLSGDERAGRFSFFHIPEWKYSLLKVALKHRIDQLDRLIQQGMMTTGTKKAVENLFNDITYHFYRSNCGATCYISVGLGQKKESVASLSQQAEKLREQYRKGELQGEVLKAVEADLGEKLRALEVLSDFTPVEVTQDEIQTRIKAWREKGQVARHWREYENVYQKARRELVKEKSEKLPPDQIAALKIAWERDQKTILELAVDLHRYGKNREAEKQLLREMSGTNALQHLLNELPKSKSYQRNEVIQGLAELGGTNVIPVLKELMKDETLGTFGRSDGSGGSSPEERDKRTTWYVHYPIRDEAGKALASMGVRVQEKSNVLCNSPEGRAMVRKGLESADHVVRRSALQCVSSKLFDDKTLIPVLERCWIPILPTGGMSCMRWASWVILPPLRR